MRQISSALQQHLSGEVTTLATLFKVTRDDGQTFGFTDHDSDLVVEGLTYHASRGYDASDIEWSDDLSPTNMEVVALIDGEVIIRTDIEAGLWDFAQVDISLVNYNDPDAGTFVLSTGVLGEIEIRRNQFRAELRGLADLMAQNIGELFSPTCRARFGDAKCKVDLEPLTFSDVVVTEVINKRVFRASELVQQGPVSSYTSLPLEIPNAAPRQLQPLPPGGGTWLADQGVRFTRTGRALTKVSSSPRSGEYTVSNGLYTFSFNDRGEGVRFTFSYAQGYFTYGTLTWLSGENEGYGADVWRFGAGSEVTLLTPMTYPVVEGDTFTITAGCDKTAGMCRGRFNNIINFRGEPFLPGPDAIIRRHGG